MKCSIRLILETEKNWLELDRKVGPEKWPLKQALRYAKTEIDDQILLHKTECRACRLACD